MGQQLRPQAELGDCPAVVERCRATRPARSTPCIRRRSRRARGRSRPSGRVVKWARANCSPSRRRRVDDAELVQRHGRHPSRSAAAGSRTTATKKPSPGWGRVARSWTTPLRRALAGRDLSAYGACARYASPITGADCLRMETPAQPTWNPSPAGLPVRCAARRAFSTTSSGSASRRRGLLQPAPSPTRPRRRRSALFNWRSYSTEDGRMCQESIAARAGNGGSGSAVCSIPSFVGSVWASR